VEDENMPRSLSYSLILMTGLCLGGRSLLADPLDNWSVRNPDPVLHGFRDVVYGNNMFVAVGDLGTVMTSPDGIGWFKQPPPTTNSLYGIVHREDRFFAVSSLAGRGAFLASSNGTNWGITQSVVGDLQSVAYGRGLLVAGGTRGEMYRSADGTNWILFPMARFLNSVAVVFANDQFIATSGVGGIATATAAYSPDGTNWFSIGVSGAFPPGNVPDYRVAFGEGTWVSAQTMNYVRRPTAALDNWERFSTGLPFAVVTDMTFGLGKFVAVGLPQLIMSSPDATNWTSHAISSDGSLAAVTSGNGRWVAVGQSGLLLSSENAQTWTIRTKRVTGKPIIAVTSHEDGLTAVGMDGFLARSSNGEQWAALDSGTTNNLNFATKQNGVYLVGGTNGTLRSGSQLGALQLCDSKTTNNLASVAFGRGRHVIVGWRGTILTSTDGTAWTLVPSGTTNDLRGICFADGTFVVVGQSNVVLSSADGLAWKKRPFSMPTSADLVDVAYGNGRFVAVSSTPSVLAISTNGLDWSRVPNSEPTVITRIAFGGGFFAMTSPTGSIRTSRDGLVWKRRETGYSASFAVEVPSVSLFGVAYHNGTFVVVGNYGAILQSDPILRLNLVRNPAGTLEVLGPAREHFEIEGRDPAHASTAWESLVVLSNAPVTWTDPESSTGRSRLYRAKLVP
jgi:hypothetical protein